MKPRTIIIISDLHIGSGPLDDCDEELEKCVCSFIEMLTSWAEPVGLVIAGDFLDFIQASPWDKKDSAGLELQSSTRDGIPLCFTERQSCEKFHNIVKDHKAVFSALSEFLSADKNNLLTILPGNHDVDFFWEEVRSSFQHTVGAHPLKTTKQIRFWLEPVYRLGSLKELWCEHGHQYDPVNCFEIDGLPFWGTTRAPILTDRSGVPRLLECVGTRLMLNLVNEVDRHYHFVDNVKPLFRLLTLMSSLAKHPTHKARKAKVLGLALLRYLSKTLRNHPGDYLSLQEPNRQEDKVHADHVKKLVGSLSAKQCDKLGDALRRLYLEVNMPLTMFVHDDRNALKVLDVLSHNIELWDILDPGMSDQLLGIGEDSSTLSLAKHSLSDETKLLQKKAFHILKKADVQSVVMGHTHEPLLSDRYANIGCWTRYFNFKKMQAEDGLDLLTKPYGEYPYELNYALVKMGNNELLCVKCFKREKNDAAK
jgi:UDP-2,3-diacylglucosamine pyrophosphatase LpxH